MASVVSEAIAIDASAIRQASNSPAKAQAVENWVPLISPNPSLGPRIIGSNPAFFRASPLDIRVPSKVASPAPIIAAAICASGARSPEAPTEPCDGITGMTPRSSICSICSITSQRTPDAPRPMDSSFSVIISRVLSSGSGSPTPQQWLRIRLRCRVAVSSGAILVEASLPNPVLMP